MADVTNQNFFFRLSIITMVIASVAFLIVSFSLKDADARMTELKKSNHYYSSKSLSLLDKVDNYREQIDELATNKDEYAKDLNAFNEKVLELEKEIAELELELSNYLGDKDKEYPFAVPSSGVLPNFASGYGANMRGMQHFAVDIWTTTKNNGIIPGHKGNPVYSACDGRVSGFDYDNGAVMIACDDIPSHFNVPAHKGIVTYYGHLGNGETKEHFILVGHGQRVEKGQLIGYQGDLSKFFPEMRNVHLHFQLWAGGMNFSTNSINGPHNPCHYIGGNCNNPGEIFIAGGKN